MNLIFDADDTLWENNIYFEAAFDKFVDHLNHSSLSHSQVRAVLDEIEIVNAKLYGYGSKNFANNLVQCLHHLAERDISDGDIAAVRQFADAIREQPMQLIDGVAETVAELSKRHSLTLFTKGDPEEQHLKIDRSGLGNFFSHKEVVKEKNTDAYRALVARCDLNPEDTWMIGNSPKSDISPALEAGIWAVYVPHDRTWSLERAALPAGHAKLRIIEKLPDLLQLFA